MIDNLRRKMFNNVLQAEYVPAGFTRGSMLLWDAWLAFRMPCLLQMAPYWLLMIGYVGSSHKCLTTTLKKSELITSHYVDWWIHSFLNSCRCSEEGCRRMQKAVISGGIVLSLCLKGWFSSELKSKAVSPTVIWNLHLWELPNGFSITHPVHLSKNLKDALKKNSIFVENV